MKSSYISIDVVVKDTSDNAISIHQHMTQEEQECMRQLFLCEAIWENIVACHDNIIKDIQIACMDHKISVNTHVCVDVPESINLNELIDSGIRTFGDKLCEEPMRLSETGVLVTPFIASYTVS